MTLTEIEELAKERIANDDRKYPENHNAVDLAEATLKLIEIVRVQSEALVLTMGKIENSFMNNLPCSAANLEYAIDAIDKAKQIGIEVE